MSVAAMAAAHHIDSSLAPGCRAEKIIANLRPVARASRARRHGCEIVYEFCETEPHPRGGARVQSSRRAWREGFGARGPPRGWPSESKDTLPRRPGLVRDCFRRYFLERPVIFVRVQT